MAFGLRIIRNERGPDGGVDLAYQPAVHPWVSSFLKQLRKENLSSNSLRAYRNDLQVFWGWYESSLEALTAVDVMNYWRYLTREGAQQATINRKLQTCVGSAAGPSAEGNSNSTRPSN